MCLIGLSLSRIFRKETEIRGNDGVALIAYLISFQLMVLKHRRILLIRLAISVALLILILLTAPYLNAQEEEGLNHTGIPVVTPSAELPNFSLFPNPNSE